MFSKQSCWGKCHVQQTSDVAATPGRESVSCCLRRAAHTQQPQDIWWLLTRSFLHDVDLWDFQCLLLVCSELLSVWTSRAGHAKGRIWSWALLPLLLLSVCAWLFSYSDVLTGCMVLYALGKLREATSVKGSIQSIQHCGLRRIKARTGDEDALRLWQSCSKGAIVILFLC